MHVYICNMHVTDLNMHVICNMHVANDQHNAGLCGEKVYSMATGLQSSAGLVSNMCLSWRIS